MLNKLFCYLVDFGDVSSGSTYTTELPFASDSEFVIKGIRTNLDATTEAKISIKKETGEELSNAAFALRAIAGVNNVINVLDEVVVPRGSKWTISANVSAGTAKPLQLQFWGIKR
jgi:hypothetical protein